jgi:hypothetical protein
VANGDAPPEDDQPKDDLDWDRPGLDSHDRVDRDDRDEPPPGEQVTSFRPK